MRYRPPSNRWDEQFEIDYEQNLKDIEKDILGTETSVSKAQIDATKALSDSNAAVQKASNTQAQVDALVIGSNTSPAETVQARIDETGKTFETLKAHLDDKGKKIKELNQSVGDIVNLEKFGAVGDNSADNTNAFKDFFEYYKKAYGPSVGASNNRSTSLVLTLPPGVFKITSGSLFNEPIVRRIGLTIKGSGRGTTTVVYEPNAMDASPYLFDLDDFIIGLTMEDITFVGHISKSFMCSTSRGGNQLFNWRNCSWNNWDNTHVLEGTNNNSEMTWHECTWNGLINRGLYIPEANSSDQFLNYDFYSCNFEVQNGTFIEAWKGGCFRVFNGSVIQISDTADKPFYKLRGASHWRGTEHFYNVGTRYEHRGGNSQLIDSEWGGGSITFDSINTHTNDDSQTAWAKIRATFRSLNTLMPIITFRDCTLGGKHKYIYGNATYTKDPIVNYERCHMVAIRDSNNIDQFLVMEADNGHLLQGGIIVVNFKNCRGSDSQDILINTAYNKNKNSRAVSSRTEVFLKGNDGQSFSQQGKRTINLPLGSIIRKVEMYSPVRSDITGGRTLDFRVQTNEATPTILAQKLGGQLGDGFYITQSMFFVCDTHEKRKITVGDYNSLGLDRKHGDMFIVIEYS
ncbi:hypothetical protein [Priestia megaterium]|uniref:hypothetical protein n=1 Tax=Priestia megaterium TaxID=1404 RepID=UPI0005C4458D|nr:hypothetical protein [Priestia megaterium]